MTGPEHNGEPNPVLSAFRARFSHSRDVAEYTPFGFYEAGWSAGAISVQDRLAQDEAENELLRAVAAAARRMHAEWGHNLPDWSQCLVPGTCSWEQLDTALAAVDAANSQE